MNGPAADRTPTVDEVVATLDLHPHPEGGWYRETWRAAETIPHAALPERFGGDRATGTSIYYLASTTSFSALHRIRATEVFHFYAGDPAVLCELYPDGTGFEHPFGPDVLAGHVPQVVVQPGTWFGLWVPEGGPHGWTLAGCTVSPGFDFDDFELADRTTLAHRYPAHHDVIERLVR